MKIGGGENFEAVSGRGNLKTAVVGKGMHEMI